MISQNNELSDGKPEGCFLNKSEKEEKKYNSCTRGQIVQNHRENILHTAVRKTLSKYF